MGANRRFIGVSILASGLGHAVPLVLLYLTQNPSDFSSSHTTIEVEWCQPQLKISSRLPLTTDEKSQRANPKAPKLKTDSAPSPSLEASRPPGQSTESHSPHAKISNDSALCRESTNRKPDYPEEARLLGIEGTVSLHLRISPDGKILESKALEPKAHPLLEQSALKQVKTWRFPRTLLERSITLPIKFELD